MLRITKEEIELSFYRLLVDAEDDFFPDPLRYKDLNLIRKEIIRQVIKELRTALGKLAKTGSSGFAGHQFFDWDVPKGNNIVRHAICLHPIDRIIYNFTSNRLVPLIEPKLSKARYSYRVKNMKAKYLFGKQPVKNWLAFKNDAKHFFSVNKDYNCLVSTDIAGFYEYTHITHFKNQIYAIVEKQKSPVRDIVELLNAFLKNFSPSKHDGIPQNYDPSSYLASAFLDFLDKELESRKFRHFRYVDDIKVACKDKRHAQEAIIEIIHALRRFNLNLSTIKTEIWHRNDEQFHEFFREFPPILEQIDVAVKAKDKNAIDTLLPGLVKMANALMKKKGKKFDERLFRAYTWRILKSHWFKNIRKVRLDTIGKKCIELLVEMPGRTDAATRFLVLLKNRKFVHSGCANIIINTVYSWQEMLLWELLIKVDRINEKTLLDIARDRVRKNRDSCPARNFAIIFLGKHGTYQDREYIASIVQKTNFFKTKRCLLIALQEYQHKTEVYNSTISTTTDLLITGLVKYLKQLKEPEYILDDKRIGSDLSFVY